MSEPYIGEIKIIAFDYAPRNWAFCDGQTLPIIQNEALFALIGNSYGGDGNTTFCLPDLRGRVPVHSGKGPGLENRTVGEIIGLEKVSLDISTMPAHTHSIQTAATDISSLEVAIKGYDGRPDTNNLEGNVFAQAASGTGDRDNIYPSYSTKAPNKYMDLNIAEVSGTVKVQATALDNGGDQSHNNMQPSLVVNYVIALEGMFPPRS